MFLLPAVSFNPVGTEVEVQNGVWAPRDCFYYRGQVCPRQTGSEEEEGEECSRFLSGERKNGATI